MIYWSRISQILGLMLKTRISSSTHQLKSKKTKKYRSESRRTPQRININQSRSIARILQSSGRSNHTFFIFEDERADTDYTTHYQENTNQATMTICPRYSLLLLLAGACAIREASAFDGASFLLLRASAKESDDVSRSLLQRGGFLSGNRKMSQSPAAVAASQQQNSPQPKRRKPWGLLLERKRPIIALAMVPLVLTLLWAASGSVANATTASNILPKRLGKRNIILSTLVLSSIGVLPLFYFGISSLAKSLLVSASRCALQVSLLGSIVLQRMMAVKKPEIVLAWILGVGLVAGREAVSRIKYSFPNKNRNLYGSVLVSGVTVLGLTLTLNLFGKIQPFFDPRTWIPIAGMLFGNTLNASALAASSITKQFATSAENVELRWIRGATTQQATMPLLEESLKTALMPTVNGLAATGIIHIPGMMSGQILAGQSPQQAALYQIVINFLIASTSILSVQLIVHSTVRSLIDTSKSRLRGGVLELDADKPETKDAVPTHDIPVMVRSLTPSRNRGSIPVLELKNLVVLRAKSKVDLALHPGDRIAISGKSGAGKSQILRTIVGLEEAKGESEISLFGNPIAPSDLPSFRRRVCLVPPNKPNLEGTPNQFYQQILRWNKSSPTPTLTPSEIAKSWGLPEDAMDRDWRTLSGGESQRAALAIALALQPDVLLLDESTSQMDKATSLLVEKTLRKSNIPMIVVTHSEDQLNRFCTNKIVL